MFAIHDSNLPNPINKAFVQTSARPTKIYYVIVSLLFHFHSIHFVLRGLHLSFPFMPRSTLPEALATFVKQITPSGQRATHSFVG